MDVLQRLFLFLLMTFKFLAFICEAMIAITAHTNYTKLLFVANKLEM